MTIRQIFKNDLIFEPFSIFFVKNLSVKKPNFFIFGVRTAKSISDLRNIILPVGYQFGDPRFDNKKVVFFYDTTYFFAILALFPLFDIFLIF